MIRQLTRVSRAAIHTTNAAERSERERFFRNGIFGHVTASWRPTALWSCETCKD
jgi:hypothetical protein